VLSSTRSEIRLRIYGDLKQFPDYVSNLRRLSGSDSRIEFAGKFDRKHMSSVYEDIDALIVPSLWYENSPIVILEAFANSVPVVASNLGGMAEMVDHETNGLLFTPDDPISLHAQIERIAADRALLRRLSEGTRLFPLINMEEELDAIERFYQIALSGKTEPIGFQKVAEG
jgi:glycosyltransferase involved in cell wall biosynthesis